MERLTASEINGERSAANQDNAHQMSNIDRQRVVQEINKAPR